LAATLHERARAVIARCLDGLWHGNAFLAAAAVAFWFFLSLVPLLVFAGFLIGQVARARGVDVLITPLVDVAPETAVELVRKELERLGGSGTSVAPLGVVGFMWTASSGVHNLMDVVEQAATAPPRAWWKQRALSLLCVALGLAAACLAAWMLVQISGLMPRRETPQATTEHVQEHAPQAAASAGKGAAHAAGSVKHRAREAFHATDKAVAGVVVLVLGVVLLAGFYRIAIARTPEASRPPGEPRTRSIWPGTLFAVTSWLVVSWGFGAYVSSLGNYALYYGSLATVAITLMWLYLTSLSLVVGAYVNAATSAD
jgi:membrane protein